MFRHVGILQRTCICASSNQYIVRKCGRPFLLRDGTAFEIEMLTHIGILQRTCIT